MIAALFDNRLRPDTTGLYCYLALRETTDCFHMIPEQLSRAVRADFYLQIDDGTSSAIPEHFRPSALWAIDTHLSLERLLSGARRFDFVFCAQRPAVDIFLRAGLARVSWLPLAAAAGTHHPGPTRGPD
jgi:hypothetical protein